MMQYMNEALEPLVKLLGGRFGWMPTALGWMSAARLAMKFFNLRLQGWLTARMVEAVRSADAQEGNDLEALLRARWYRRLSFAVDLLFSVKLPAVGDYLRLVSEKGKK
jgi:hypothetical protein